MNDDKMRNVYKNGRWNLIAILGIFCFQAIIGCGSSGYKEENGKITFNGKEITDKNFVVLNETFAKNDSAVYFKVYTIPDADINTFIALDRNYAKDQHIVFYCNEVRDGQNYYLTKKNIIEKIINADPATFTILADGNEGYAKDDKRGYFMGVGFAVADPATLTFIERRFVKDKHQLYFEQKPFKIATVHSFRLINNNYARDSFKVFYFGYPSDVYNGIHAIPCHAETFSLLEFPYSKDQESAFFFYHKIPGADAANFTVLSNYYSKDTQRVYLETKIVPNADASTFELLMTGDDVPDNTDFARDRNRVYWKEKVLPEADPNQFKVLGLGYATDGKHIFYQNNLVKYVDPASFKIMQHGYGDADAEDGKNKFWQGKVLKED